jgi:hypothetical protein
LWTALGIAVLVLALDMSLAPMARAAATGDTPEYCNLNLTTGDWSCTTNPAMAARLTRPSVEGVGAVVLGKFYDEPNQDTSGGFFTVQAATGCDDSADIDFWLSSVPSGWNDRVSSFQGFNSCQIKLWQNGGFSGATFGPVTYAYSVGALDNAASSITFH